MKELKDIVLKKGDKITYKFANSENNNYITVNDYYVNKKAIDFNNQDEIIILKIERLQTIYEAPKQILDKEEKDIILKKGDVVCFENGDRHIINADRLAKNYMKAVNVKYGDIIKIERPVKYETICEAPYKAPILDKEEKEYLENVIRPFRDRVVYIEKTLNYKNMHHISIECKNRDVSYLPSFKKGTMYKEMEVDKEYTLKELGLFE